MVSGDMINAGDFDGIERLTREAVKEMLGFEVVHIGINAENEQKATATAKMFANIFGFELREDSKSIFAGKGVEIMKSKGFGDNGHIAIGTNYMNRAVRYLKAMGVKFDDDSKKIDDKGNLRLIYLADDFCGFRIHLVRK